MSDYNPCCFCLGGDEDVPPFGALSDAQDFVSPCSTCSLTAHRKCLLDWFSSLPSDKLKILNASVVNSGSSSQGRTHSHSHTRDHTTDDEDDDELYQDAEAVQNDDYVLENNRANNNNNNNDLNDDGSFEMLISPQQVNRWLTNMTSNIGGLNLASIEGMFVLLVAPCPQCKGDITFSMKRSQLLTLHTEARTLLTRAAQFGVVFTVAFSAVTGVLSMSYIGLTACGLKIMDSLVPGPLLVKMLSKSSQISSSSPISQMLTFNSPYATDNLESALSNGVIDPFKFSRIPILPIVLYRMRSSSLISCLIGIKVPSTGSSDNSTTSGSNANNSVTYNLQMNSWLTEIMINGYISSLGSHKLLHTVANNFLNRASLFEGVDFWNVNNMMSMLVPLRWSYDLFYRLTINRLHFNIAMKNRPRDIANSLQPEEFEKLEELDSALSMYRSEFQRFKRKANVLVEEEFSGPTKSSGVFSRVLKPIKKNLYYYNLCQQSDLPQQFMWTKLSAWLLETKACVENDYSSTLFHNSFTLRCITTVIWPYLSSKLGGAIYFLIKKYSSKVPSNKLLLLSNIIGLVGVVLVKDLINLYLCSKKAQQLSKLVVVSDRIEDKSRRDSSPENTEEEQQPYMLNFPGGYSMSIRLR